MSDLYEILGIDRGADADAIKRAYKKNALKYHPDKPTGNKEQFQKISMAYQVLSDKTKRHMYDLEHSSKGTHKDKDKSQHTSRTNDLFSSKSFYTTANTTHFEFGTPDFMDPIGLFRTLFGDILDNMMDDIWEESYSSYRIDPNFIRIPFMLSKSFNSYNPSYGAQDSYANVTLPRPEQTPEPLAEHKPAEPLAEQKLDEPQLAKVSEGLSRQTIDYTVGLSDLYQGKIKRISVKRLRLGSVDKKEFNIPIIYPQIIIPQEGDRINTESAPKDLVININVKQEDTGEWTLLNDAALYVRLGWAIGDTRLRFKLPDGQNVSVGLDAQKLEGVKYLFGLKDLGILMNHQEQSRGNLYIQLIPQAASREEGDPDETCTITIDSKDVIWDPSLLSKLL